MRACVPKLPIFAHFQHAISPASAASLGCETLDRFDACRVVPRRGQLVLARYVREVPPKVRCFNDGVLPSDASQLPASTIREYATRRCLEKATDEWAPVAFSETRRVAVWSTDIVIWWGITHNGCGRNKN